jgi:hypothetical protein
MQVLPAVKKVGMVLWVSKTPRQLVWGGELEDLVLRLVCSRMQRFDPAMSQALALWVVVDQTLR